MPVVDPTARQRRHRTYATLAFVVATAAIALYLWTRPTTIRGEAAAAMLLELGRAQFGDAAIRADCDPRTPVTARGASVECTLVFADRRELHFDLRYQPDGGIQGVPIAARSASRALGPP